MADVEWAKKFFDRVTATLPDLLTKHGEGKELEAIDELKVELVKERDKDNAQKRMDLTEQLNKLGGPAPQALVNPAEAEAKPKRG